MNFFPLTSRQLNYQDMFKSTTHTEYQNDFNLEIENTYIILYYLLKATIMKCYNYESQKIEKDKPMVSEWFAYI